MRIGKGDHLHKHLWSLLRPKIYWESLLQKSCLKNSLAVLGGDLNFSLGAMEIWGPTAQVDPLTEFLIAKLEIIGLLDISPVKLSPTWRNMRIWKAHVRKKLIIS